MKYTEYLPSNHIAGFVRCFWTIEHSGDHSDIFAEPILPDGCPEIVFNLAAPFRRHYQNRAEIQPRTVVVGQMKQFVLIEPSKQANLFGVRFHPFGLYPLIRQSLADLTDRIESIDSVFNRYGNDLEDAITGAESTKDRISVFEKFFCPSVEFRTSGENFIRFACSTISESGGMLPIGDLTRRLGTNSKQLERQFNKEIGLSPKSFSRITRLQSILQNLNKPAVSNWADLSYQFGYFDQAHFIKDFKEFTGNSPNEYMKQQKQLTEFFIQ